MVVVLLCTLRSKWPVDDVTRRSNLVDSRDIWGTGVARERFRSARVRLPVTISRQSMLLYLWPGNEGPSRLLKCMHSFTHSLDAHSLVN